jgi:hypothetical protein
MLVCLELLVTCAVQGIAHYTWALVVRGAPRQCGAIIILRPRNGTRIEIEPCNKSLLRAVVTSTTWLRSCVCYTAVCVPLACL